MEITNLFEALGMGVIITICLIATFAVAFVIFILIANAIENYFFKRGKK